MQRGQRVVVPSIQTRAQVVVIMAELTMKIKVKSIKACQQEHWR